MAGVRGRRERGSVFRRRRMRGVVLLSLVLVFTIAFKVGVVQIDDRLATGSCRSPVWQLEKLDGRIHTLSKFTSRRVASYAAGTQSNASGRETASDNTNHSS